MNILVVLLFVVLITAFVAGLAYIAVLIMQDNKQAAAQRKDYQAEQRWMEERMRMCEQRRQTPITSPSKKHVQRNSGIGSATTQTMTDFSYSDSSSCDSSSDSSSSSYCD